MNPIPPPLPSEAPKKSGMPTWAIVLIVLGAVGVVMIAVIGLLAAIAVPNFVRSRDTAQRNSCINNLRQIDGAKQQWALENKKKSTDTPAVTNVTFYLKDGLFLVCPKGGKYTIGAVNVDPTCSVPDHKLPAL